MPVHTRKYILSDLTRYWFVRTYISNSASKGTTGDYSASHFRGKTTRSVLKVKDEKRAKLIVKGPVSFVQDIAKWKPTFKWLAEEFVFVGTVKIIRATYFFGEHLKVMVDVVNNDHYFVKLKYSTKGIDEAKKMAEEIVKFDTGAVKQNLSYAELFARK